MYQQLCSYHDNGSGIGTSLLVSFTIINIMPSPLMALAEPSLSSCRHLPLHANSWLLPLLSPLLLLSRHAGTTVRTNNVSICSLSSLLSHCWLVVIMLESGTRYHTSFPHHAMQDIIRHHYHTITGIINTTTTVIPRRPLIEAHVIIFITFITTYRHWSLLLYVIVTRMAVAIGGYIDCYHN